MARTSALGRGLRMVDQALVGRTATVTGRVAPGTTGEVVVHIRGGTETYFARAADGSEVINTGQQALIVGAAAGRVVYVTAFDVL